MLYRVEKDTLKQLVETSRKFKLSENVRSAMKRSVLNFINEHPPKKEIKITPAYRPTFFFPRLSFVSAAGLLLVVLVLVGGGATFGAEKALPGDMLYPIKVGVNEEVQGWLKASEEEKIDWEIQRADLRLEEAEKLIEGESLDAKTIEKVEKNFQFQAEKVRNGSYQKSIWHGTGSPAEINVEKLELQYARDKMYR